MPETFHSLKTFPLIFKAAEEMYYDNNSGGLKPRWETDPWDKIKGFKNADFHEAENFLRSLTKEQLEAFTSGDQDACDELLGGMAGYKKAQAMMESLFEGENSIFVGINICRVQIALTGEAYHPVIKGAIKRQLKEFGVSFKCLGNGSYTGFLVDAGVPNKKWDEIKSYLNGLKTRKFINLTNFC